MDLLTASSANTIAFALGLTFAPMAIAGAVLSVFRDRGSLPATMD